MNIAIIGAGGSIGRQIAHMIVSERLLTCNERLILCGNPRGNSSKSLFGFSVDLMDAYAEICPQLDVIFDPKNIKGDLIIMAGGATLSVDQNTNQLNRDHLASQNIPVFKQYAHALAEQGHGNEIVICISNPNELAVAVFAGYLGKKRVIGMGAFLDSLRFRKEIAQDLNIRRQRIHGFMVGEHGSNMIPLWSSIHIFGYSEKALEEVIHKMRGDCQTAVFPQEVKKATQRLKQMVLEGEVRKAYRLIDQYPPDIRTAVKPFITHFSGSKTVMGTARAAMDFIRTIMMGNDALIAGQIKLEGEFHGIHGIMGVPFVIGNQGVERVIELPITDEEKDLLSQCAKSINEKLEEVQKKLTSVK